MTADKTANMPADKNASMNANATPGAMPDGVSPPPPVPQPPAPAAPRRFALDVNGTSRTLDADPAMPLLWALRDRLSLTGTKYGCGQGLCGACTVHLDGRPVRACLTTVSAAAGHRITTIEGLSPQGEHPVQRAWRELRVPQCGYCQSGQVMAAAALLKTQPHPSREQVREALAGHVCRCGTYARIEQAVQLAATKGAA